MDPDVIALTIPSRPEYVVVARLVASGLSSRMGFTHEDIESIKVAVGEACIHAIQYGYEGKNGKNEIIFRFLIYPSKVVIVARDFGKSCPPEMITQYGMAEKSPPEKLGERGVCIFLIRTLMDEVEYAWNSPSGTEVRMVKYLQGSPPADEQ